MQIWLWIAWIFIAVKLLSTGFGLRLKRAGVLFDSNRGRAIYALSKVSPAIFCFALYKNAQISHDRLGASTYGWLTVVAIVLATIVVAHTVWQLSAE